MSVRRQPQGVVAQQQQQTYYYPAPQQPAYGGQQAFQYTSAPPVYAGQPYAFYGYHEQPYAHANNAYRYPQSTSDGFTDALNAVGKYTSYVYPGHMIERMNADGYDGFQYTMPVSATACAAIAAAGGAIATANTNHPGETATRMGAMGFLYGLLAPLTFTGKKKH